MGLQLSHETLQALRAVAAAKRRLGIGDLCEVGLGPGPTRLLLVLRTPFGYGMPIFLPFPSYYIRTVA